MFYQLTLIHIKLKIFSLVVYYSVTKALKNIIGSMLVDLCTLYLYSSIM